MIYLLGGPPRTKKTSTAETMARDHGIPFVGTDFLGYSQVTLADLLVTRPSWIEYLPTDEQEALPGELLARSRVVEDQCRAAGVTYLDVAGDHATAVRAIVDCLLAGGAR